MSFNAVFPPIMESCALSRSGFSIWSWMNDEMDDIVIEFGEFGWSNWCKNYFKYALYQFKPLTMKAMILVPFL
jgi:hypothetical protein